MSDDLFWTVLVAIWLAFIVVPAAIPPALTWALLAPRRDGRAWQRGLAGFGAGAALALPAYWILDVTGLTDRGWEGAELVLAWLPGWLLCALAVVAIRRTPGELVS